MVEKTHKLMFIRLTLSGLKRLAQVVFLLSAFLASASVRAESIRLVTDEETELFLAEILQPIYKAAGIRFYRNSIFIVEDNSLNAFVGDGNNMFVHTGTIMNADNYNQLSGVLAHETGHIQGGHILRQKMKLQGLQQASLASLVAAGVLGAVTGRADVGMAILMGTSSSAIYNMTAYQVQEERSADEAAVQLLAKARQSPAGMRDFMKKIQQQNVMSGIDENSYFRTHPITAERVAFLSNAAEKSPFKADTLKQKRFEMIQAKLRGFLEAPEKVLRRYPLKDVSAPARYARSIAYFKQLKTAAALKELDSLIAEAPKNPFFYELKGQIYTENGQIAAARAAYQKAYDLLPYSALFQLNLAQIMLEASPSPADVQKIINLLNKSLIQRPDTYAWLFLSRAYGMKNDEAYANYAAAEFSLRIGELDVAERQAGEARKYKMQQQLELKLQDLENRLKELQKIRRQQMQQ